MPALFLLNMFLLFPLSSLLLADLFYTLFLYDLMVQASDFICREFLWYLLSNSYALAISIWIA